MLNPKTDRINYGDILIPPSGYSLLQGVGTTYSLDLNTVSAICISLGIQDETDGMSTQSPVCMLHAIEKVSDKVVIFCESGQASVPKSNSPLYLLLEKMLVPVTLKSRTNGFYNSFHAKCWILEYENAKGEKLFRFIVMSRNMTTDRSWDVCATFDGVRRVESSENANALKHFLTYMKDSHVTNEQTHYRKNREILSSLINDLTCVHFDVDLYGKGKPFTQMNILPIYDGHNIMGQVVSRYHDSVIISPFLSKDTVKKFYDVKPFAGGWQRRVLITRATELKKVEPYADGFDVYTIKNEILNGEIKEGREDIQHEDIHAKMYLTREYSWSRLYLGSMNASDGSTEGNVEMMVCLTGPNRYLNGQDFLKNIFDGDDLEGKNAPFEKVDFPLPSEDDESKDEDNVRLLTRKLKDICRMKLSAKVNPYGENYMVVISGGQALTGYDVTISPMRRVAPEPLSEEVCFNSISLTELSEFYSVKVSNEHGSIEKIIIVPTQGIPEERDNRIISSIIKRSGSFLDYVCYVLGNGSIVDLMDISETESKIQGEGGWNASHATMPALYELMLKTAARDKDRIREIKTTMDRLAGQIGDDGQKIVSDEFQRMYQTFVKALKLKKR